MRGINITEGFVRHNQRIDRYFIGNSNKYEKYKLKENDLVIGMDGSKVGKNCALITNDDSGSLLIQRVARLRTKSKATIQLVFQQVNSNKFHSYVDRINTSSGIPHISAKQISEFDIGFPQNEKEQQKITGCLSSIDDLIAAHTQKHEALKAHKKGLMQRLFPAEGETVPKYRFPQFRDAGEWEENELGKYFSRHPEYGINEPAVPYSDNLPTYLRITDISKGGVFLQNKKVSVAKKVNSENYLREGDIVLARTGASVGKSYKYRKTDGHLVFAGFLIRVKPDESVLNAEFLFQFLSTERYWRWVDFVSFRSGQPGINGNEYASMPISLPPTLQEQQNVADCLSSIDDLIAAHTQIHEALKTQKKGLMQQLFPAIDEVSG